MASWTTLGAVAVGGPTGGFGDEAGVDEATAGESSLKSLNLPTSSLLSTIIQTSCKNIQNYHQHKKKYISEMYKTIYAYFSNRDVSSSSRY